MGAGGRGRGEVSSGNRVLVIGSSTSSINYISEKGFDVCVADSVATALETLSSELFDCILLTAGRDQGEWESVLFSIVDEYPNVPLIVEFDGDLPTFENIPDTSITEYIRSVDLEQHGEVVAHRIQRAIATDRQRTTREQAAGDVHTQLKQATAALTDVQEGISDSKLDVEEKIERILEVAADRLEFPVGYVARRDSGHQEIVAATGDHEILQTGSTDPLGETYCRQTVDTDEPVILEDAPEEGWDDDPAYERFGLRCDVSARILVDDDVYGTLCFADERPRENLAADVHQSTVKALARSVGYLLTRQRYESELEASRERLRVLFEESPDAIAVHDVEGEVLDVNRTNVEELGYSYEDFTSMNVMEYATGIDPDETRRIWRGMDIGDRVKVEAEHERADGSTFPVEVWVTKLEIHGEEQFLALSRNVSERKTREKQLRTLKERLELAVEGANLGVWDWDMRYFPTGVRAEAKALL